MPASGYIKVEKSITEVQEVVETKFTRITFGDLIDEEVTKPRRYKIKCVYLHSTLGQKRINFFKPNRTGAKLKQNEVTGYDRFIVLGVEGTDNVILAFTKTGDESKRILLYHKIGLQPGSPVWLLCPKVEGFLKQTQNPLISTGDPLVLTYRSLVYKSPPQEVGLANFVYFDFKATNFNMRQAVPKNKVCTGTLCDAQVDGSCPCIAAKPREHWAITFIFCCDELSERITGEEFISFTSMELTKLFVHVNKRKEPLSSDEIDVFDMEEAVCDMASVIDSAQGFRVCGWFKPASDEDGVTAGNFCYHVSAVSPCSALNPYQKTLMYGAPSTDQFSCSVSDDGNSVVAQDYRLDSQNQHEYSNNMYEMDSQKMTQENIDMYGNDEGIANHETMNRNDQDGDSINGITQPAAQPSQSVQESEREDDLDDDLPKLTYGPDI